MLDIIEAEDGKDLNVLDSIVSKAGNVLSVQLGSLEYAPDFGVDLDFFLTSEFQIQNDSFRAYAVQRLTEHQVNVSQVIGTIDKLMTTFTYKVGEIAQQSEGLIL